MKIVFCWATISGYMAAGWRALAARESVDIHVIARRPNGTTAGVGFEESVMNGVPCSIFDRDKRIDERDLHRLVCRHEPDAIMISGWQYPEYRSLTTDPTLNKARFLMGMDTPRQDTWRQRFGRFAHRRYFAKISRVIVAGERSFQLARVLGFADSQIGRGLYPADLENFAPAYDQRLASGNAWPRQFLYVGRYADAKGINVLIEANKRYRARLSDPWPVRCCGMGQWAEAIRNADGFEDHGFVQPSDLRQVYAEAGVFVLPSRFEPFGVVITEACAAGLPIICTESVGASVELVRPYYNGRLVGANDPEGLTQAMCWMHERYEHLAEIGARSRAMAEPFGADMWAERIESECQMALGMSG